MKLKLQTFSSSSRVFRLEVSTTITLGPLSPAGMPSIAEYPIEGAAAVSILDVIETEGWGGWCGGGAVKLN